ncbi:ATP-binding protein [Myxococcus sp. AB036A]|uniref:HD domain-containing protein n=1 Tax=Myxococcus sp. AB036A TaxID=2562793 RepID=UPI0018918158|nr:ATP-binding protein [Myxococcus sp. AB036A]
MTDFRKTKTWLRTLAPQQNDQHANERDHLRTAFEQFRERAGTIAEEIKLAYPSLTEHGITHLDALWEMTDLITGDDYPINPAEAFVLGGAFLVHDLGNGLAAFPNKEFELRSTHEWKDAFAVFFRREENSTPETYDFDNPPPHIAQRATEEALRVLHARQAEKLALISWTGNNSQKNYLIEDSSLRSHFGKTIGEIAYSHWWDISEVEAKFNRRRLGAATSTPPDWSIDALKLACILRAADAAHIDSRRAPKFLMALRTPTGLSNAHWTFQSKISKPILQNNRLTYSTGEHFSPNEINAFWLCFETLKMIDRELHNVDSLLSETGRQRLTAIGVSGVEDAARLSKSHIPTDGWTPVDTQVHISNIPAVIQKLGGYDLYGDEPTVPFRELIQNGADAIRARRILENRPVDWGALTISLGRDEEGNWIEFEDTGIGMSEKVLTRYLLNFGTSFWWSDDMRREQPGLAARRFEPTGKFGIGFFSVFMWGDHIRVTSCSHIEGASTNVLEFNDGLHTRPLLRKATKNEQLHDGGTRIRVWFSEEATLNKLLEMEGNEFPRAKKPLSLKKLSQRIAPSIDIEIRTCENERPIETAIKPNDWKKLPIKKLLERTDTINSHAISQFIRPIANSDGTQTGRACLCYGGGGLATIGGLRSGGSLSHMAGFLQCDTDTMRRDSTYTIADSHALTNWASEQAILWTKATAEGRAPQHALELITVAHMAIRLGGEPHGLPIAWLNGNTITLAELCTWAKSQREITLSSLYPTSLLFSEPISEEILREISSKNINSPILPETHANNYVGNMFYTSDIPELKPSVTALIAEHICSSWSIDSHDLHITPAHIAIPSNTARNINHGTAWKLRPKIQPNHLQIKTRTGKNS